MGDQRSYARLRRPISKSRAEAVLGRERTGLIDVSIAEAAASKTTEAATATAQGLVRAVRREEEED